jgi:predicted nucleic acid-binding Zn ribbon protein
LEEPKIEERKMSTTNLEEFLQRNYDQQIVMKKNDVQRKKEIEEKQLKEIIDRAVPELNEHTRDLTKDRTSATFEELYKAAS